MVKGTEFGTNENTLSSFPGPIILRSSRKKWLRVTIGAGCFTVVSGLLGFGGDIIGILGTAFFGICTLVGVITLLPGASWLRLDEKGFEFTRFFRTTRFHWSDVGDFGVWTFRSNNLVVFKATKPRLSILEKINTALSGRNGYLPDTYGMAAEDLVQLMTAWRDLATNTTVR